MSSRGTTELQIIQRDQSLLPLADAIALLNLNFQLPPEIHAKLLRRGVLSCHTSAACQLVLVPTSDAVASP